MSETELREALRAIVDPAMFDGNYVRSDWLPLWREAHEHARRLLDIPAQPERAGIDGRLDALERIMHPEGRCAECGGGKPYWKHGDRGDHAFRSAEPEQADPWNGHQWMQREQDRWAFCRVCGTVRRADDKNKPCKGPVRIGLRAEPEQADEVAGLDAKIADRLALVYLRDRAGIAALCDEQIDRSGNLLGWLRDYARLAPARDDGGAS